ncbi:MAG TPA: hypothetical protein VFD77_03175 [Brumimicrobium sp.]|nr:hypothetical protein [Brumimicrobium sp.]
MKIIEQISLDYAEITVYENGIFQAHFLNKTPLSVEQATEINDLRLSLLNNKKALILSTSEDSFVVPTKEAVEYIQSANRSNFVKANAFVIKSFSQRLAIKEANNLSEMPTPIAYFGTEKEAIDWLLSIED